MLYAADVKEVFNLPARGPAKDAVGIEIEMELTDPMPGGTQVPPSWSIKTDGSLRNYGYEFVSEPTSLKNLPALMDKWEDILKSGAINNRIEDCPRASVHVHVNVRDLTYGQLMNVMVAYLLLEGVLVAYCGRYRFGNLFALRIPEAQANFRHVASQIREYAPFKLNGDNRYGAFNLCSVSRFGTVEFRSLGSVYSTEGIDLWTRGLRHMVDHASREYKTPPDVYQRYVDASRYEFLSEFLGPLAEPLLKKVNNIDELFEDGEEYAIRLLSSNPDNWTGEKDFRANKEFVEYATQFGYRKHQILQMTRSNAKTVMFSPRS